MTFEFLAGASVLASGAIALFFLRFWLESRDRLFLIFAIAFATFAVNRVLLSVLDDKDEARTVVYLARAVTFALIALAVLDKNWPLRPMRIVRRRQQRSSSSRR
jgi:nitrate/nitrite transporter NarK